MMGRRCEVANLPATLRDEVLARLAFLGVPRQNLPALWEVLRWTRSRDGFARLLRRHLGLPRAVQLADWVEAKRKQKQQEILHDDEEESAREAKGNPEVARKVKDEITSNSEVETVEKAHDESNLNSKYVANKKWSSQAKEETDQDCFCMKPEQIQCFRVGDKVEYFSKSSGTWRPAYVSTLHPSSGKVDLDVKLGASVDRVRWCFDTLEIAACPVVQPLSSGVREIAALPNCSEDALSPTSLATDHDNRSRSRSHSKRERRALLFDVGDHVEYYSKTKRHWVPTTVQRRLSHENERVTYDLRCKFNAPANSVRRPEVSNLAAASAVDLKEGDLVEYWSTSSERWLKAMVIRLDLPSRVDLDVKPKALVTSIRRPRASPLATDAARKVYDSSISRAACPVDSPIDMHKSVIEVIEEGAQTQEATDSEGEENFAIGGQETPKQIASDADMFPPPPPPVWSLPPVGYDEPPPPPSPAKNAFNKRAAPSVILAVSSKALKFDGPNDLNILGILGSKRRKSTMGGA